MIKKRSTIFFILAFIIMSLSIFSSSAFMISNLERSVNGGYISDTVAEDAQLAGFPAQLDLIKTDLEIGRLTNNSGYPMTVNVRVDPNITYAEASNAWWGMYIKFVNTSGTSYATQRFFEGRGVSNPAAQTTANFTIPVGGVLIINGVETPRSRGTAIAPTLIRMTCTYNGNTVVLEEFVSLIT